MRAESRAFIPVSIGVRRSSPYTARAFCVCCPRGYNGGTLIRPFQRRLRKSKNSGIVRRKSASPFFQKSTGGKGAHTHTFSGNRLYLRALLYEIQGR